MRGQHVHLMDDDCWELIFRKLDYSHDIAAVSLVCKKFLSITNQLMHTLRVTKFTAHLLPKLLKRFHQIKSILIVVEYEEDCSNTVFQISQSGLKQLETLMIRHSRILPEKGLREMGMHMKGLKKLSFCHLSDDDLIELSDWFPVLEELGVNGLQTTTDRGLEVLASKLKRLKKISLSYCNEITDRSLVSLSSNCANLTDVQVNSCTHVTVHGIGFLMRHSSKLTFLSLVSLVKSSSSSEDHFTIENSISYAKNLEEISFESINFSDGDLCAIAKSCLKIKKIFFNPVFGTDKFSMRGLAILLGACSSLRDLTLRIPWLTDESVLEICKHIRDVKRLEIFSYCIVSKASFFALTKTCQSLESIKMGVRTIGNCETSDIVLHRNYQVKELTVAMNTLMNDQPLVSLVSVCPNLERLCISSCLMRHITDEEIAECLELCPKLWYLDVSSFHVSNFMGLNENNKLKLKFIRACHTFINDEALDMIGKRCPYLESLEIEKCHCVSNDGLKQMVSKCEKLRKINLNKCKKLSIDVLDLLMNLRPSLKEIITPLNFVPSDEQKKLFLRKGCNLVSKDDWHAYNSDTYDSDRDGSDNEDEI